MSWLTNPQEAEFWIAVGLAVFAALLWRAKVPGLAAKALDDAGAKVRAQLDEARSLRDEARALLAEIKAKHEATERAGAGMMAAARADAERLRAEAAVKLEEDVARRAALAERKIAIAEAQAAAEMAAGAAEAVLAARIAGAACDPLIDAGLARLGERFT